MLNTVGMEKRLKLIFVFAAAIRRFVFEEVDPNVSRVVINKGDKIEILAI